MPSFKIRDAATAYISFVANVEKNYTFTHNMIKHKSFGYEVVESLSKFRRMWADL
jgi:hypothetical protein